MTAAQHGKDEQAYASALQEYLAAPTEGLLERAYGLGRAALSQGVGMLELLAHHRQALATALAHARPEEHARVAAHATDFLSECLAPFEIAQRSYQETSESLRRVNRELTARAEELEEANRTVRRGAERSTFLAAASRRLSGSLDPDATLAAVVELPIGRLADGCVVELFRDEAHHALAAALASRGTDSALVRDQHAGGSARAEAPCLRTMDAHLAPRRGPLPPTLARPLGLGSQPGDCPLEADWLVVPMLAHGQQLGALALVSLDPARRLDVRDRELAEEYALRAAAALENARLYREAREAVAARDDFLAIACHELKTPLTPLALVLERARSRLRTGEPIPDTMLETANRQVQRLVTLTRQMLSAALAQSGVLELHRQPVLLTDLVQWAVTRRGADASRIEVHAPVGQRGRAWVDVPLMRQVLEHLLGNALQFSEPGTPVRVEVDATETRVRLAVMDRGIGVPDAQRGRLFEPFFRAENAPVQSRGGLGLGLYLCRAIIELHGGRIWALGREGGGTCFVFELPLSPPAGAGP